MLESENFTNFQTLLASDLSVTLVVAISVLVGLWGLRLAFNYLKAVPSVGVDNLVIKDSFSSNYDFGSIEKTLKEADDAIAESKAQRKRFEKEGWGSIGS